VRPIHPDDSLRLAVFHEALSPQTLYMRFFSPHPKLTEREVYRFTHVDFADRLALIAEIDGELVAVSRYERQTGTSEAEVAFVVADAWQHHGIASVLLDLLARSAWLCGIDTFTAVTLADNHDMLHVFSHSAFDVSTHLSGGVIDVRFSIAPGYHRSKEGGGATC
jgi:GNAT superfamily N-acetyltransferase